MTGILDALIDWDAKRSADLHRRDEVARLTVACSPKCGNCRLWMTSDCAPEKLHGQFKSVSSAPCPLFAEQAYIGEMRKRAAPQETKPE